jgi:hypothetical protein
MVAAPPNSANEPEDPQGLIGQVLAMGAEFPGPAGDVLLSWLLDLKDRADPAKAAARLIERHGLAGPPFPPGPLGELIRLLHETARYSPEQLSEMGGRRRGGRRGRVPAGRL